MEVILKQNVEKLGRMGEVVNVKDGFARNFLFPRSVAMEANKANLKVLESIKLSRAAVSEKEKKQAQALADKLQGSSFTMVAEANADDKLYGSVGVQELAKFLEGEGYQVDERSILIDEPIKALGAFEVDVRLHPEVIAKIKVWIVKK